MFTQTYFKILLVILLTGLTLWSCQEQKSNQEKIEQDAYVSRGPSLGLKTISIRNETNELLHYTVIPVDSSGYPEDRALRIGEIDRILAADDINLTFRQNGEVIRSQLSLGKNYSFAYNKQHRIILQDGWSGVEQGEDLAPFLATPMEVVDLMLEMASIDNYDIVYDLGCGDGRIVIRAAEKYGAHGVGIDFNPTRIKESLAGAKKAGVESLVEFRLEDVTKSDFSKATVVTVYLLTRSNARLRPLLEDQLRPGTRVVAHNYEIPGWEYKEIEYQTLRLKQDESHTVFLYKK